MIYDSPGPWPLAPPHQAGGEGQRNLYPLPEPCLPLNVTNSTGLCCEAEGVRRCLLKGRSGQKERRVFVFRTTVNSLNHSFQMKGEFKGKTLQLGETVASAERLVRLCQNPLCCLTLKCPLPHIAFTDWLFQLLLFICTIFSLLLLPHCMLHCECTYFIAFLNEPVSLCVTAVLLFVSASLKGKLCQNQPCCRRPWMKSGNRW